MALLFFAPGKGSVLVPGIFAQSVRQEGERTTSNGRNACLLHIIALVDVLRSKVRSVYPDLFPNALRPLLNLTISPSVPRKDVLVS